MKCACACMFEMGRDGRRGLRGKMAVELRWFWGLKLASGCAACVKMRSNGDGMRVYCVINSFYVLYKLFTAHWFHSITIFYEKKNKQTE